MIGQKDEYSASQQYFLKLTGPPDTLYGHSTDQGRETCSISNTGGRGDGCRVRLRGINHRPLLLAGKGKRLRYLTRNQDAY